VLLNITSDCWKFVLQAGNECAMICLCDLEMPFGELVVPDEQHINAVVDEMFGRSENL